MKDKWLNWRELIIDDSSLSFGAKAIAMYLNTFMNSKNDLAWPSQATIAGEMSTTEKTVRKYLDELAGFGYIRKQKRFSNSIIYHAAIPTGVKAEIASSVNSTFMEDLPPISVNSTVTERESLPSNNQMNNQVNNQVGEKRRRFVPPTQKEVQQYITEKEYTVDAERFINFYESNGWKVGKNKMVSWKHAVANWNGKEKSNGANRQTNLSAADRVRIANERILNA